MVEITLIGYFLHLRVRVVPAHRHFQAVPHHPVLFLPVPVQVVLVHLRFQVVHPLLAFQVVLHHLQNRAVPNRAVPNLSVLAHHLHVRVL